MTQKKDQTRNASAAPFPERCRTEEDPGRHTAIIPPEKEALHQPGSLRFTRLKRSEPPDRDRKGETSANIIDIAQNSETRMLPRDQIATLLKQLKPELARYLYPAYVIDYIFRFWMVNATTAILVGGYENMNRIINYSPTFFDVLFESRLGVNSAFFDIEGSQRSQIYRFKLINQFLRFETSYRNIVR